MNEVKIFCTKDKKGNYYGEHISDKLQDDLLNLEYGDVASAEFQVWEYPSGKIYDILPDRHLPDGNFSTPSKEEWLPILQYRSSDIGMVQKAYKTLKAESPSSRFNWKKLLTKLKK